jgi:hypothetical protein
MLIRKPEYQLGDIRHQDRNPGLFFLTAEAWFPLPTGRQVHSDFLIT